MVVRYRIVMKISFPLVTKRRLRWLLDQAYRPLLDKLDIDCKEVDDADSKLLRIASLVQHSNIKYRQKDIAELYQIFNIPDFLEPNSEGTTLWLAMALAIKELCSLTDEELRSKIYSVY